MVDTSARPDRTHLEIAEALLAAGVRVLQLRMKGASDAEVRAVLDRLVPRLGSATLILNDRVDLAATVPGVGVHLGQGDLDPAEARRRLGPDRIIGWSTHTLSQVRAAASLPVQYIAFGPVFSAAGKYRLHGDAREPMSAVGVEGLRRAVEASERPVIAIGGIDQDNLPGVLETGVCGVAVIAAVAAAPDMTAAARRILDAFDRRKDRP
jgi:thiamine-phosphate pyrophosphorylase